MRPLTTTTRLAAIGGLLSLVALPLTADAQLGGLKRRLGEQMTRGVLGQETARATTAPTFDDRVLEITDTRLDQLVLGLRAEAAHEARDGARQKELAERDARYAKASEAYGTCAEPYAKAMLRTTGASMGLAMAAQREQARDGRVSAATQDSLTAVTTRLTKMRDEMVAKCGQQPVAPSFAAMDDDAPSAEETGARAAGLAPAQYAVLRERIAAFLKSRNGDTGRYAFAAGERALLERRAADLAAWRAQLAG